MSDGNNTGKHTLLDVLLTLKNDILQNTNVAEVCKVTSINSEYINVELINDNTTKLICVSLQNLNLSVNDIVLVVFTNTDYRINLLKIKSQSTTQNITQSTNLHSKSYGIIVGIIYSAQNGG